jgi:post-segregation antitoxin (ccd killing protein)
MKTKEPLIRVDGRANPNSVAILKKANINISAVIRDAIDSAAKKVARKGG